MKIVLSYSGGLDTTVAIRWLQEKFSAEVYTVTVDVGQTEDFSEIESRAYKTGAKKHYLVDAKKEFADEYIARAIIMNGNYEGSYPLATALARPLIASKVVEVGRKEGADAIAHGSTSKGNDQVRFDLTIMNLFPEAKVIAPARIWGMTREDEVAYAKRQGIQVTETHSKYSIDENLWGRSIEGEATADPFTEVPEDAFLWTRKTKENQEEVVISFNGGIPSAINDKRMPLWEIIKSLNQLVGSHGLGRYDHIENRLVGFKSREVYEAPAAMVLLLAHRDLEKTIYTPYELRFKEFIDREWSDLVYRGLWLEPLRETLDETGRRMNKWVTGDVRVKLDSLGMRVIGRRSEYSSYSDRIASYNKGWYPSDEMAKGFIEIWGLHSIMANRVRVEK